MTSKGNPYFKDEKAFIFQLDDQKIFKIREPSGAVYYDSNYLITIGSSGNEIAIQN